MKHAEMSSKELLDLLNDIDEQDWLEAKSLRDDTSRSILETVCSFSSEPGLGGGIAQHFTAMEKVGLPPPVADERDGFFKVVFGCTAKGAEGDVGDHLGCASEVGCASEER